MRVRTRTWFSFVVAASLLFMAASRFGIFDPLEDSVLTVTGPAESALRDATDPLADFVTNLTDINRLSNDNRSLREANERLRVENARLAEAERDLHQLEQLSSVRRGSENDVLVPASVFLREPGNLRDMVAIDKGKSDGVAEGMVVLTSQGSLIGSVTDVLEHVAWVTLVTDQTSAVSAMVQSSRVQGVVAGGPDGTLTMEFVEETADVREGDMIVTSGIGGRHPQGELIGQVVEVESSPQELFKSVHVEPLADLSRLEDVLVLQSFLPLEAGAP
jgi:rod shape-determining protein MreC